jgi:hypothetical protein
LFSAACFSKSAPSIEEAAHSHPIFARNRFVKTNQKSAIGIGNVRYAP